ncbi:MAG: hypothetical protein BroJett003_06360 [Planctomycetota bacterium]|nr:MAG: hypothetical protein BroJett003_06360 [Planctomycetota bacterium]
MSIEFRAIEFPTAGEAIQHTYADPRDGVAVLLGGKHYVMQESEADRLAAAGVEFAYLCDHEMPDGTFRIVTVPVND